MTPNTEHTAPPDLREIVKRVGGDLYLGGRAALVPGPGHSKADRSLSLSIKGSPPRLLWCSHASDNARDVWRYLGLEPGQAREETPAERRARQAEEARERRMKLEFCAKVWSETVPAIGSPVERYLRGRAITGEIPTTLRFHPAAPMRYPWNVEAGETARTSPAMIAIATASDGKSAAGIHATLLLPDGSGKAALRRDRLMFGDLAGAVVQLGPFPTSGELGVAEGIETALSYRQLTGTPTWAALSTSGVMRFAPPEGIARLVIAADGDPGGLKAAETLAERASRRCAARIVPAPEGQDWNDVLKGGAQ